MNIFDKPTPGQLEEINRKAEKYQSLVRAKRRSENKIDALRDARMAEAPSTPKLQSPSHQIGGVPRPKVLPSVDSWQWIERKPMSAKSPQTLHEMSEVRKSIIRALTALSTREAIVLRLRFGIETDERTLRAVGTELGVGPERVRQIEAKALRKLRHPTNREPLERAFATIRMAA